MKRVPKISEAEWEVMRVVWMKSPVTAQEVVDGLIPEKGWSPRTVKTLLNRLVRKKALSFTVQGKAYLYSPMVGHEECVRAETRSLVDRVFDGAAAPLLAHFVEHEDLSPGEIAELRKILSNREVI